VTWKEVAGLLIYGLDGKSVEENAVSMVEDYGVNVFPFTRERRDELKATDERKRQGGKIEELLTHEARDDVISRYGRKV